MVGPRRTEWMVKGSRLPVGVDIPSAVRLCVERAIVIDVALPNVRLLLGETETRIEPGYPYIILLTILSPYRQIKFVFRFVLVLEATTYTFMIDFDMGYCKMKKIKEQNLNTMSFVLFSKFQSCCDFAFMRDILYKWGASGNTKHSLCTRKNVKYTRKRCFDCRCWLGTFLDKDFRCRTQFSNSVNFRSVRIRILFNHFKFKTLFVLFLGVGL